MVSSGTFIGFATAPGDVSSDNVSGHNGLFTGELLKFLDQPGLKIEDVFKRTARAVQSQKQQIPWFNSSLTDDFYFVPPLPVSEPTVPPSPTPLATALPLPTAPPIALPTAPVSSERDYTVADPVCVHCPAAGKAGISLTFRFQLGYEGPEQMRAVVDWGDGSAQSTGGWLTESGVSTLAHRYARPGRYTIQVRSWTQSGKKSERLLRQGVEISAPDATPALLETSRLRSLRSQRRVSRSASPQRPRRAPVVIQAGVVTIPSGE